MFRMFTALTLIKMKMPFVKKSVLLASISAVFILIACSRSLIYLYDSQTLPLKSSVYMLRFSPAFSPFTKVGRFENTQNHTSLYIRDKEGTYWPQDVGKMIRTLGGPHEVRIVVVKSSLEFPKGAYFDNQRAALQATRFLFCRENPAAESILINTVSRSDEVTNRYVVPCADTL